MAISIYLRNLSDPQNDHVPYRLSERPHYDGESIQYLAQESGLALGGLCGGIGRCTTCRATILAGQDGLTPLTREEKAYVQQGLLKPTERLLCQCSPRQSSTEIEIAFEI